MAESEGTKLPEADEPVPSSEPSPEPSSEPSSGLESSSALGRFGRRRLLEMMAALVGVTAAELALGGPVRAQERPPAAPSSAKVDVIGRGTKTELEFTPIAYDEQFDDVQIYFDSDHIPLKYVSAGQVYELTEDERDICRQAKEKALEAYEPEVGYQFLWQADPAVAKQSFDMTNAVTEAPSDLVDADTLTKYGIASISSLSAAGDTAKLRLRQSLFEKDGILEPLVKFNQGEDKTWMQIVLVPGSTLAPHYIPDYDGYVDLKQKLGFNESQFTEFLTKRAEHFRLLVEHRRAEYASPVASDEERKEALNTMLDAKINQRVFLDDVLPADAKIDEYMFSDQKLVALGLFCSGYRREELTHRGLTSTIFIANPTAEQQAMKRVVSFCYREDGTFAMNNTEHYPMGYGQPRADTSKSYPSPKNFPDRAEKSNYLYEPNGVGWVLIHELAHLITIDVLPQMVKDDTVWDSDMYKTYIVADYQRDVWFDEMVSFLTATEMSDLNYKRLARLQEQLADSIAKEYFQRAYTLWQATGDDSGYGLAFEIPETERQPGGWQITGKSVGVA